jgi:nucleoside-diphosphate-sugar epimerase
LRTKNNNILILGHNSFIALHFIKLFSKKQILIWPKKKVNNMNYINFVKFIKKNNISIIINFISDNNNDINNYDLVESFNSNSLLNLFLLEIILKEKLNIKLMLFSSFEARKIKKNEISIYGINKKYIENIINFMPNNKRKFIKLVKINSVFGPGDKNLDRVMPFLLRQIIFNKKLNLKIDYKYFIRVDHLCNSLINFLYNDKQVLILKGKKYKLSLLHKKFLQISKEHTFSKKIFSFMKHINGMRNILRLFPILPNLSFFPYLV